MQKEYKAPQLTVYGNVEKITQFGSVSGPEDTFFGEEGFELEGNGSSDGCVFDSNGQCTTGPTA